jgi:uncharacterized protein (TIGR03083 family)
MSDRKQALRDRLKAGRAALDAAILGLTDDDWDRPTSNPAWTARDLLTHLTIAEPGLLLRTRRILEGTSQLPPGFDLNVYNERQIAKRRGESVSTLRSALDESRGQLLSFLDSLDDDQFDQRGWHASGREVTVSEMFEILAWHEETHAKDILSVRAN